MQIQFWVRNYVSQNTFTSMRNSIFKSIFDGINCGENILQCRNVANTTRCHSILCDYWRIWVCLNLIKSKNNWTIIEIELLFSFILMYFILPETEQRSLEDIELHFSDNLKRMTDVYIPKQKFHMTSNGQVNNALQNDLC